MEQYKFITRKQLVKLLANDRWEQAYDYRNEKELLWGEVGRIGDTRYIDKGFVERSYKAINEYFSNKTVDSIKRSHELINV